MFSFGDIVNVKTFRDGVVKHRVVKVCGDTICVCNEQEFQNAVTEKRKPSSIGFPAYDVMKLESELEEAKQAGN